MSETYFEIVQFVLEAKKIFLIWCSSENSDYFENIDSRVVAFQNKVAAIEYLYHKDVKVNCETVYDFDKMDFSDCNDFLNKWNIISDLSKSISLDTDFIGNDDNLNPLYKKIVCGSNLPALNTSGKTYTPTFDADELRQLEAVKSDMLKIVKNAISNAEFYKMTVKQKT